MDRRFSLAFRPRPRLARTRAEAISFAAAPAESVAPSAAAVTAVTALEERTWQRTCFYSTAIGEPEREEREHSDGFLESLVRPAIAAYDPKMKVVRADELASSPITTDVFKHVLRSGLMVADLSFHNPNVFLEIGLRYRSGLPCVLISRAQDPIPSNIRDVRTVLVNTGTWRYNAELQERREELTSRVRWALSPEGLASDPIEPHVPGYRDQLR